MSRRSIICLSLRLRQIIDLLATDKSRYFAQPRPIIINCQMFLCKEKTQERIVSWEWEIVIFHVTPKKVTPVYVSRSVSPYFGVSILVITLSHAVFTFPIIWEPGIFNLINYSTTHSFNIYYYLLWVIYSIGSLNYVDVPNFKQFIVFCLLFFSFFFVINVFICLIISLYIVFV